MSNDTTAVVKAGGRVLIVIGDISRAERQFALGAQVAQHQTLPLVAMIRENTELMALAELPFARQIDRISGIAREFNPLSVDRAFTKLARYCARRLEELKNSLQLNVTLEFVRGAGIEGVFATAQEPDVLILNAQGQGISAASSRVGVVYANDEQLDAFRLGADIAAKEHGRIHLLLPNAAGAKAPTLKVLRDKFGSSAWTYEQTPSTLDALFAAALGARLNVLVLSRRLVDNKIGALQDYLRHRDRCVVLIP